MAVTVYKSTDTSAPVLSGTVGSLIGVLDACLVNGYGAKSAAGWTKAFSGTNLAAYRQGGGNSLYLRVDDTPAQYKRVVAYESMSDVNTGTNAFPTAVQQSGGLYLPCSDSATSVARAWVMAATDRLFHFFLTADAAATSWGLGMTFGDFKSYKPGDIYGTIIFASVSGAVSSTSYVLHTTMNNTHAGHYTARAYTQTGTAISSYKMIDYAKGQSSGFGGGGIAYPNPADGGLYMSKCWLHETGCLRGELPGIWSPCHTKPLNHLDTVSGTGVLAGRTFLAFCIQNGPTQQVMIETSNTWDT